MIEYPRFNVTIRVTGVEEDGQKGVSTTIKLRDISRKDIMREDYPANIQALAKATEHMAAAKDEEKL